MIWITGRLDELHLCAIGWHVEQQKLGVFQEFTKLLFEYSFMFLGPSLMIYMYLYALLISLYAQWFIRRIFPQIY